MFTSSGTHFAVTQSGSVVIRVVRYVDGSNRVFRPWGNDVARGKMILRGLGRSFRRSVTNGS